MSWRETSRYMCTASLYLSTASLYQCTASLYLEKVVASKQLKFAMETDVEGKARLEKMVGTKMEISNIWLFGNESKELHNPMSKELD